MKRDWWREKDNSFFWGPFTRQYENFYPKSIEQNSRTPENPNAYFPRWPCMQPTKAVTTKEPS